MNEIMLSRRKYSVISIAMCTYNGLEYFTDQIESILCQTRLPDEIIICDDGSTDGTIELINAYVSKYRIIKLIVNNHRLGYMKNFEKSIMLTTGDLIFLSDQDDIWHAQKIQTVLERMEISNSALGLTHDGRIVDATGHWYGTTKMNQIKRGYGKKACTITGSLSCLSRDCLELVLPFPENINYHDTWINYIFSWLSDNWIFIETTLSDIRRHTKNSSVWVVNSFQQINKFDIFREQYLSKVAIDYDDRKYMNIALNARLSCAVKILAAEKYKEILSGLSKEKDAIVLRQLLVRKTNIVVRYRLIFYLLLSGGYKYFNSYRSFLRDLLR